MIEINSISEMNEGMGLPKPKHPLITIFHPRSIKIKEEYIGVKARVNLYQIWFNDGVTGAHGYGRNSYDFNEGTLAFVKPGQVLQSGEKQIAESSQAWSLVFHPDLIRKSTLGQNIEDYTFFNYEIHEALHVSDEEKIILTELKDKIEREYNQNIDKHSQKLIIANIELILDYCLRYYDRQFYTRTNFNQDIITRFNKELKDYFKEEKQLVNGIPTVKYMGEALHSSPNYLSDLLKKETGKSAQELVHNYVIEQAKNKLMGSTSSVGQIAYDLGFEYPQHFSKLFKKKTGKTPVEYRGMN